MALGDYAARSVLPEIQRVPGVGQAQLFGTERAMRVWVDPARLLAYRLAMSDVTAAIATQNVQVSSGFVGEQPATADQRVFAAVVVKGQLANPAEFGNILLRANPDGSSVRLRDVARVELGAQGYGLSTRLNGQPSTGIGVQLAPNANALETAALIKARLDELSRFFPPGMKASIP